MIIISTQCYPPQIGGVENLMHCLSTALTESGEQPIVFADGRKRSEQDLFDAVQPFRVIRYAGFKPWRRRKKAADISRYIADNSPDTVKLVTDSWKSLEFIDSARFSHVVCLVHGTEIPLHTARTKAGRICGSLAKATHVVANSEYTANRTRPYLDPSAYLGVIHPGISAPGHSKDTMNMIQQQLGNHGPVLITVARLEKRKGHHRLLQLLPRLIKRFPGLLYIIVGEGSQRATLESIVRALRLQKHVLFTGAKQELERNAYIHFSDIFIMPGDIVGDDVEGFGMACIEAACLGVPSIACDSGGVTEAVLHDQTGLICKAGDQQQLYDSIRLLLEDGSLRRRLGATALKRSAQFLWPNKITEYRKLLEI